MNEALATRTSLRNTEPTAAERIEQDSMFDRDSDENLQNHPEWCVDLGTELKAMNKFELWLALGTGDVASSARVWRVGRECWQPAFEIPDLACALKLHAQVLMATVRAAESDAESDRVTLVPGELPAVANAKTNDSATIEPEAVLELSEDAPEVVALPDDAMLEEDLLEDVLEDAVGEAVVEASVAEASVAKPSVIRAALPADTMLVEADSVEADAPKAASAVTPRCEPIVRAGKLGTTGPTLVLCDALDAMARCEPASQDDITPYSEPYLPRAQETEMQQNTDRQLEEVDAKSVTPGPAVVDAPVIEQSVIRQRRGLPRKKETSIWSGVAALTALAATTLLTLPGALAGNTSNAAAHLPNLIVPSAWIAAAHAAPSATPVEAKAASPIEPAPVAAADTETKRSETHPAAAETKSEATQRPSKHRVRPTSVSPSHRGQGRSRQRSR